MMNKKLLKELKPIEEKYGCELFTFDEALNFYRSDIKRYKRFIKQLVKEIKQGDIDPELLKGVIAGLKQGVQAVDVIFGGRVEDGF